MEHPIPDCHPDIGGKGANLSLLALAAPGSPWRAFAICASLVAYCYELFQDQAANGNGDPRKLRSAVPGDANSRELFRFAAIDLRH